MWHFSKKVPGEHVPVMARQIINTGQLAAYIQVYLGER